MGKSKKLNLDRLLDTPKIKYRLYRNDWIVVADQELSVKLINEFNYATGFKKIHYTRCVISVDKKHQNDGVCGISFPLNNEEYKFSNSTFKGTP